MSQTSDSKGYRVLVPNLDVTGSDANNINYMTLSVNNTKADSNGNINLDIPTFTVLFNDPNGSDALSITLSDSVANYNCLDIQWVNNDNISNSTRIYDPDGKRISVINMFGFNPGNPEYINKAGIYDLSGTSMTQVCKVQGTIRNNSNSGVDYKTSSTVDGLIKITKVVGIKY